MCHRMEGVFDDGYRNLDGNLLMKEVVGLFMNCDDGWEGNHPCSLRDLGKRGNVNQRINNP